jgi:hypothetical protein
MLWEKCCISPSMSACCVFQNIVTTVTLNHIVVRTKITLYIIVAFDSIVAFVISLVALLTLSPMLSRK